MHLAGLLRLDEIVSVTVPSVEREAPGIWYGPVMMSAVI